MIQLNNLSTGYGKRVVARGLNQTLIEGELTSLLGSNGVGKSTLLRTLCAFQPSLEGDVLIDDKSLSRLSASERSRLIGVVLTDRVEVQGITVRDLVALGRSPYTGFFGTLGKEDEQQVQQAMEMVGIVPLQHRDIHTLSDGERQKAMIAKALAQQTPVILLDEPTAFLDFPSKVEMLRLLRMLAEQMHKIILLSTHDVDLALQLSHRLWLMTEQGIQSGTPQQLMTDGSLQQFMQAPGIRLEGEQIRIETI